MPTRRARGRASSSSFKEQKKTGRGVVNKLINKLPFELHLRGYQFCGPGTKLSERLARGDSGVNGLDKACKAHDIAYAQGDDLKSRHKSDYILEQRAWERVKATDSGLGEKTAAWLVTTAMKAKRKLGMGISNNKGKIMKNTLGIDKKPTRLKKKRDNITRSTFGSGLVKSVRETLKSERRKRDNNILKPVKTALIAARSFLRRTGGKRKVKTPRVIPIPKTGGILPLIPIFAGLSALGALASGASGVAKAINKAKDAKNALEESKRHNQTMEAIAMGKGLYLKPYRNGLGLYLHEKKSKN